jgi:hypothetical protein
MSDDDKVLDEFMLDSQNTRKIVQGDFVNRPIHVSTPETELVKVESYEQRRREFEDGKIHRKISMSGR